MNDPLKQILTRAVFALKTPSPDGSKHYQSGWDDGLEAAIGAVAEVFDQLPSAVSATTTQALLGAAEIETRPDLNITPLTAEQLTADEEVEPTDRAERRDRYAAAIRETDGWVLDGGQHTIDAVMAVADAEQAELRRERDLAVAHDRQPYPTAWAYEQACKALHRKEAAIERVLEFAASLDEIGRQLAGPEAVHPVAAHIRHLLDTPAAEAPEPATQDEARRGDAFEAWLKAQRDEYEVRSSPQWAALNEVLDTYRLHADTGTPLGEHVCEGRTVGDCECLEQPAAAPAAVQTEEASS